MQAVPGKAALSNVRIEEVLETRQLSYFVIACQYKNHAEAAAGAGISSSALSENINQLEQDLGIKLFQRGPIGHYPTEAARWLYQRIEPVLQTIEAAEAGTYSDLASTIGDLTISTPLQFALGRLSRAISLAVRQLRAIHPGLVSRVRFEVPVDPNGTHLHSDVVIDYGGESEEAGSFPLYHDDWIAVTNFDRGAEVGRVVDLATLRRLQILMPPLLPAQRHHLRAYCALHDLPEPKLIEDDIGTFPRLSRDSEPFALLAPRSLVAAGLSRLQLDHATLPEELTSPVIARIADHGAARDFVRLLAGILASPTVPVLYQPSITLRQLRYFLALTDQLNLTAAARKLHVVQPALSGQLRKLEKTLGIPLFERHHMGLTPTAAASGLTHLFKEAIEQCDQVAVQANRIAPAETQRIIIGVVPLASHLGPLSQALAAALESWICRFPAIKLQVVETPASALSRWVDSGEISLAIVEAHVSRSSQLDLQNRDRLVVVSKADGDLLPAGDMSFSDCVALPLVLPGPVFGLRQILDQAAERAGLVFTPQMEVNSISLILALVRRMRIATILPESAVTNIVLPDGFQHNTIVDPPLSRRLSIVFSTDRNLTGPERELVELLKHHLAQQCDGNPEL